MPLGPNHVPSARILISRRTLESKCFNSPDGLRLKDCGKGWRDMTWHKRVEHNTPGTATQRLSMHLPQTLALERTTSASLWTEEVHLTWWKKKENAWNCMCDLRILQLPPRGSSPQTSNSSGPGLCKAPWDNCIVLALYKYNLIELNWIE